MKNLNIFVLFAVDLRYVFTEKLNIDVNSAVYHRFVLKGEESQAVRTVETVIIVRTTNKKPSVSFVVDLRYLTTTGRKPSVRSAMVRIK